MTHQIIVKQPDGDMVFYYPEEPWLNEDYRRMQSRLNNPKGLHKDFYTHDRVMKIMSRLSCEKRFFVKKVKDTSHYYFLSPREFKEAANSLLIEIIRSNFVYGEDLILACRAVMNGDQEYFVRSNKNQNFGLFRCSVSSEPPPNQIMQESKIEKIHTLSLEAEKIKNTALDQKEYHDKYEKIMNEIEKLKAE
jgi:hypothetical protein